MGSLKRLELLQSKCINPHQIGSASLERVELRLLKDCFDSGLLNVNYKGFIELWEYVRKIDKHYRLCPRGGWYILFSNSIIGAYKGISKYIPKSIPEVEEWNMLAVSRLYNHILDGNYTELEGLKGSYSKHWNGREFVFTEKYLNTLTRFVGSPYKFYDVDNSLLIMCKSKNAFVAALPKKEGD